MDPKYLPPLSGAWLVLDETQWSGYDTDSEEMRSWSEVEIACLWFHADGKVSARIGDDETPGLRSEHEIAATMKNLSSLSAAGTWQTDSRQGLVGYALSLKLPYVVPTFWVSHSGATLVFLEPTAEGLNAQRFYPGVAWDDQPRQHRLLKRYSVLEG